MKNTDNAFAAENVFHTHKIKDTSPQTTRFAMKPLNAPKPAPVSHTSFNCLVCKKTYRLPEMELLPLLLPEGFTTDTLKICISGTCDTCNQKK
jgi:Fe2+ or Zn2+ uptake regulation protein